MKESNKQFDDVKASLHTEALALADYLDNNVEAMLFTEQPHLDRASAMIRRLVEELDKQSKPVNHYEPTAWINHIKQTGGDFYDLNVSGRGEPLYRHPPQLKPLSDEEILNIAFCSEIDTVAIENDWNGTVLQFARAIEERHGIK